MTDRDAGRLEEHYQPVIEAAMPAGWEEDRSWPLLVDLTMAECNPHVKTPAPCIEVRVNGACVGYFTPAMTDRHRRAVLEAGAGGDRVTATAQASRGTKAGASVVAPQGLSRRHRGHLDD